MRETRYQPPDVEKRHNLAPPAHHSGATAGAARPRMEGARVLPFPERRPDADDAARDPSRARDHEPSNGPAFLRCFGAGVRATLYDISVAAGLSIADALSCARALEAQGLLRLQGREDGADRRRMVELTATGRRRLRALSHVESAREAPVAPHVFGTAEGSGGIPKGTA